jgi:hypothetical protein
MATTTNYGWTTPDDTALVKDGAAAIRTLGSSADTTVKSLNPGTTAGDIDYYTTSTTKARVGIGTAGQVLRVNSGATAPEWFTPAGGGKVLQVVYASTNTITTIATTSYTDTTLTATITPSLATSKVLVIYDLALQASRLNTDAGGLIQLLRGATVIQNRANLPDFNIVGATQVYFTLSHGASYLDTPNTTSATTYKIQARTGNTANSGQVVAQQNNTISTITLLEIGA